MNKEQFREYRRNQRICNDNEHGYPYKREEYFNKIPYQYPPRRMGHSDLAKGLARAREVIEWQDIPGQDWTKKRVVVSHDNPRARETLRQMMRNNYRYY